MILAESGAGNASMRLWDGSRHPSLHLNFYSSAGVPAPRESLAIHSHNDPAAREQFVGELKLLYVLVRALRHGNGARRVESSRRSGVYWCNRGHLRLFTHSLRLVKRLLTIIYISTRTIYCFLGILSVAWRTSAPVSGSHASHSVAMA